MQNQREIAAMWDQARVASQNYIRNRSAGIYLTVSPQETYSGSAVCVEIGNRLFLATAGHNFEGVENGATFVVFSANRSSDRPLQVIRSNLARDNAPGSPDLAWLEIDVGSARASELIGISIGSIDARPQLHLLDGYVAAGLPVAIRREERPRPDHVNFVVPLVAYFTAAARINGSSIVLDYHREGLGPGGPGQVPEPHGMSGGPIWHVPTEIAPGEIWNPGRIRLIGITTNYVRAVNELHGIAMVDWLRLLSEDIPELVELIDPLIC